MHTVDYQSRVSWTLLGMLFNALFIGHGALLLPQASPSDAFAWIALGAIAYGLANTALLVIAWIKPARATTTAAAVLGVGYALVVIGGAVALGLHASFALLAGVVIVLSLLGANVVAVHRVQPR